MLRIFSVKTGRYVLLATVLLSSDFAMATDKPLWEIGAGVGGLSFPAYRGSDKVHNFLMPVPYFVYRGDFLKADREGIRGRLFDSEMIDLSLSLSASPPTKSDDIKARDGMPDLKTTLEFGPEINVSLWQNTAQSSRLKLRLPVRTAYTVESSPQSVGWVFSPNLNLDITDLPAIPGWNLGFVAGPIFATEKQHDYFYDVAPEYATSHRPAYQAKGGYSGSKFLVSLSKRFDHTWMGAFVRYDTLQGAVFEESPLVEKQSFAAFGIAISWILDESRTRVPVAD
jgi:outer membrane scaffolding protein for murein synthesis (MipA/OmpV family)